MKAKIRAQDQENTNLRNQIMDKTESILLLQASLQASGKECEYTVKSAVEKLESQLLFKVLFFSILTRILIRLSTGERISVFAARFSENG